MSKEGRLEYLEEERVKLWTKILELEEQVAKKTSDYEESAKLSSEQAAGFKITSEKATRTITQNLANANAKATELAETYRIGNERAQKLQNKQAVHLQMIQQLRLYIQTSIHNLKQ